MSEAPETIWAESWIYGAAIRKQFHAGTNIKIPEFTRTK